MKKLIPVLLCAAVLVGTAFFPFTGIQRPAATAVEGSCVGAKPFYGYSFLLPEIINSSAAYAPYFLRWGDYYEKVYFSRDLQREENIEEWIGRFCDQPEPQHVEYVVYKCGFNDLAGLRAAATDKERKTLLPYSLAGNTFAEMLVINGCTEVIDYLVYAKKCEPYVVAGGSTWQLPQRDTASMQVLIREGLSRFQACESHFLKMRYAYQIVRLAHYARNWQQTVDLYNFLIPKVDRKKPSIIFFWTVAHMAGALRQLGKYPEAAYRFALVFRHCPSKRAQAYRSFLIRNDQDWKAALNLCQSESERATLHILRAGGAHTNAVGDMATIYDIDPANPQLDLLLVSDVQELEKIYLRTRVTDAKYGEARGAIKREQAAQHLLDLQKFVSKVNQDGQTPNLKLWRMMAGYLELLAGDLYAADKSFDRAERMLKKGKDYDDGLRKQIDTWRILLDIMKLNPSTNFPDDEAFRIRSYAAFENSPYFEPFLQDWLSAAYAAATHPGKAILAAYEPAALGYNPDLAALDDLLKVAQSDNPIFLEKAMMIDTNPDQIRARLLEIKGAYLFSVGQPEAALTAMRKISPVEQARMVKYSPFREVLDEKIHRPITDTLLLNRKQIVEKILEYEFRAKAASAVEAPVAAWYYYLIGLAYYNMSYFGYEWEAMDFYRSGYNQLRLAQGPVFPLDNSPAGNRENTDVSTAMSYFERALFEAKNPELAARAAFMAARCQQKQWFVSPECRYKPGSNQIPVFPDQYYTYYNLLRNKYRETELYGQVVKECKWFAAYVR